MKLIAITGAPSSGKTPIVRMIKDWMAGQVMVVPEVPTIYLEAGVNDDLWTRLTRDCDQNMRFIQEILDLRGRLEQSFSVVAQICGVPALVCDRGRPDAASYLADPFNDYSDHFLRDLIQDVTAYDVVLQLGTIADPDSAGYSSYRAKRSDPSIEEILSLQSKLIEIWSRNRCYHFLESKSSIEEQFEEVRALIMDYSDGGAALATA